MRTLLACVPLSAALLAFGAAPALAYNGVNAAAYADQYWSNYNPAYPSFAHKGGDCTNFVSQALYAGGINMRTTATNGQIPWYMLAKRHSYSWTTNWVNVMANRSFLTDDTGILATSVQQVVGLSPAATAPTNAAQGDIVSYDWTSDGTYDHQAIITATDNATNPDGSTNWDQVDAHTNNRYHAYWTLAAYNAYWQTTTIDVYHIPSNAQ